MYLEGTVSWAVQRLTSILSSLPRRLCAPNMYTETCNRNALLPVIGNGVDALSMAWMILMQARWCRLRFSNLMMMKRLARWSVRLGAREVVANLAST